MRGILANLIMAASVSIVGGTYLGYATVAGASANYGPASGTVDTIDALDPVPAQEADFAMARFDCIGCTDNELGFEWAAASNIRSDAACTEGSWAFRRGCLAFTRGDDQPS